jgi:5-methylcytosine-specific restriction endonuclease McrA
VIREEPLCQLGLAGCTSFSEEVDHIIALSGGGHPTHRENLQGVCHVCHVEKTKMDMGQAPPL